MNLKDFSELKCRKLCLSENYLICVCLSKLIDIEDMETDQFPRKQTISEILKKSI